MGLYERVAGTEEPKISVHAFGSAVQLWLVGEVTNNEMIVAFNLSAGEQATMLQIKAAYDAKPNAASKAAFLMSTHSVFILVREVGMSKQRASQILGLSE